MALPPELKNCQFTADDWGLSRGVNAGILDLARMGVVSRTSALSNGAALRDGLDELLRVPGFQMGLHFNLTYGPVAQDLIEHEPAARLLARGPLRSGAPWTYLGSTAAFALRAARLLATDQAGWKAALQAHARHQLRALQALGIPVAYVDGHHHVHAFPTVLDALAPVLAEFRIERVRAPFDARLLLSARAPVALLGWTARRAAKRLGLRTAAFCYPRSGEFADTGRWVSRLSRLARPGPLEVLVHPAAIDDVAGLPYPEWGGAMRVKEYAALCRLAALAAGDSRAGRSPAGGAT
jgi:predicted glycoside hydrolase/deacetylase ChbG (UPF0249 family)